MRAAGTHTAPWAMLQGVLAEFVSRCRAEIARPDISARSASAPPGRRAQGPAYQVVGDIAVLPIVGILMQNPGFIEVLFGAYPTDRIDDDLRAAAADPSVKSIVLNIDSPGGSVSGIQEVAHRVRALNEKKRVVALATGTMASAAYWIGAAADSVFVSSDLVGVGSIGVLATHLDVSERDRAMGVKVTEIFAGKYKVHGSKHVPLSDDARATIQGHVDYLYSVFVDDVASFRGVSADTVLKRMADGRMFYGAQAIDAGLADGRASLDSLVDQLAGGGFQARRKTPAFAQAAARNVAAARADVFEARCKNIWNEDPMVRAEFAHFDDYHAYARSKRADSRGQA